MTVETGSVSTGQPTIAGGGLRWQFFDPYDANSNTNRYTFTISPNDMDSPFTDRAITAGVSTAGNILLTEGAQPANTAWTFGGTLLTQEQYLSLMSWTYQRTRRIYVYDHFGRRITCVLKKFDATPKRSIQYYWRHEWKITAVVISVSQPTIGDIWNKKGDWRA